MKTRIAINGFGRIGRNLFRLLLNHPTIEVIEYVSQMTELGDVTEPFFAEAIKQITGISGKSTISNRKPVVFVKDFEKYTGVSKYETGLRIEKELPKGFLNRN